MTVTVNGMNAPVMRMRAMRRRMEHPAPVLRRIGSHLRKTWRKQFATEGAYLGNPWKPLKPAYATWKMRQGKRRTLVFSGDLRDSYTKKTDSHQIIGEGFGEYGSTHRLAAFHEYGTRSHTTGRQLIPARKVIRRTPELQRELNKIVADYITGKERGDVEVSE